MTQRAAGHVDSSSIYPWYDSKWLTRYTQALAIIRRVKPSAEAGFVAAFEPLHTDPAFEARLLERPLDDATLAEIKQTVSSFQPTALEFHEAKMHGRFIVHDHPHFTAIQERLEPMIGDVVGEEVEKLFNFVSLYTAKGVCGIHMDSPHSKWTFDFCVDQSGPWPLYLSQVVDWPDASTPWGEGWQDRIKQSPDLRFTSHTLEPGQAVVFSGSSQWHYRDPMPPGERPGFCNLLFLQFVPRGTADLLHFQRWAERFGIPELDQVAALSASDPLYG